jgi:preprotein translocase subunit SecG
MVEFLLIFFTAVLILISGFVVLVILMQRPSANAGLGSALGGGAAESALGAQAGDILTKITMYGCVAFFITAFGLYLGFMATGHKKKAEFSGIEDKLSKIVEVQETKTATPAEGITVTDVKTTADQAVPAATEAAKQVEEPAVKVEESKKEATEK